MPSSAARAPRVLPPADPMAAYIYFSEVFKHHTRRKIAWAIYSSASGMNTFGLWFGKIGFIAFGIAAVAGGGMLYFIPMLACGGWWGFSFDRTRKAYFARHPDMSADRQTAFSQNYQYVRYTLFKQQVQQDGMVAQVDRALDFMSDLSQTEHKQVIFSHPTVAMPIAVILAVLGAKASGWDLPTVTGVVALAAVCVYFASMILYTTKSKDEDRQELKRFLLWLFKGV